MVGDNETEEAGSCWEALISTGGALSRGEGDEGGYRRSIILLVDPLASSLFMYSCAVKLEEGLRK